MMYVMLQIHILAYNADLYGNLTHAEMSPRGMTIIAIFAQVCTSFVYI
jgi:hypothetical protein